MKYSLIFILFFSFFPCSGFAQTEEHYRSIGKTASYPYYYEGLEPIFDRSGQAHYAFTLDPRRYPTAITFYNRKGELDNNREGWALFQLVYDSNGRLVEAAFYNREGRLTLSKEYNFAKEERFYKENGEIESRFYGEKGGLLKAETLQGPSFSGPERKLRPLQNPFEEKGPES